MSSRYGLEIRGPTEADAPGLVDLLRAVGLDLAPRILAARLVALQKAGGTALIALEWGPPSGLVAFHALRTLEADRPIAEITTLVVDPDARRRGIGRMLLKATSQAARTAGCDTLRIVANSDRDDIAAFCRATGFAAAGTGFVRPLRKKNSASET